MAKKKTWSKMDSDEREEAVRRLMAAGGSNTSVAEELDTTSGAIAGLRNRKGIPSTNDVPTMGKPKQEGTSTPTEMPTEPRRLKMSATEATQCIAVDTDGRRCGYEHLPDSPYCGLPQHQALIKKHPARH